MVYPFSLALAMVLSGTSPGLAQRFTLSKTELFPEQYFLVLAEAQELRQWRITQVLVGPADLKKRRIDQSFLRSPLPGQFGSNIPPPPVEKGAGLFWITDDGKRGLKFCHDSVAAHVMLFESRLADKRRYSGVKTAALALGSVYAATDEDRLGVIDRYVKSKNRIAATAVLWQLTHNCRNPFLAEYLLTLARHRALAVGLQVQVSAALRDRLRDWHRSKAAMAMIEHWLVDDWNESDPVPPGQWQQAFTNSDEGEVLGWFRGAVRTEGTEGAYTVSQVCDFAIKGRANAKRSGSFRDELLEELTAQSTGIWKKKEPAEAFDYLCGAVEKRGRVDEKVAAAQFLRMFAPMSIMQARRVRALLANGPDESVARELRKVLDD